MKNTIYSCFREIVRKYPQLPAVIEDDRTLTYAELDAMVDAICVKFYGRRPNYVGVVMHHGAEQIAAMLAVLKSGAAYVPAEPSLPQERINYMMKSAGVDFIITDNYCRHLRPADRELSDRSEPDGVAYVTIK
ncbi:MAG: AMP-binding protein [Muribaculaceae bacterium]|nr:AMP-binding protein [Muribaculaceae bacterium]